MKVKNISNLIQILNQIQDEGLHIADAPCFVRNFFPKTQQKNCGSDVCGNSRDIMAVLGQSLTPGYVISYICQSNLMS